MCTFPMDGNAYGQRQRETVSQKGITMGHRPQSGSTTHWPAPTALTYRNLDIIKYILSFLWDFFQDQPKIPKITKILKSSFTEL